MSYRNTVPDPVSRFRVSVKFQLKNTNGIPLQSSTPPTWLPPERLSPMSASIDESTYALPATSSATFMYDPVAQQYIYNWNTKGLIAGYWYKIFAKLEDGTTQSVVVGIR